MKDFYLYDDVPVLRNLLNIKDEKLLEEAESNITYVKGGFDVTGMYGSVPGEF